MPHVAATELKRVAIGLPPRAALLHRCVDTIAAAIPDLSYNLKPACSLEQVTAKSFKQTTSIGHLALSFNSETIEIGNSSI